MAVKAAAAHGGGGFHPPRPPLPPRRARRRRRPGGGDGSCSSWRLLHIHSRRLLRLLTIPSRRLLPKIFLHGCISEQGQQSESLHPVSALDS